MLMQEQPAAGTAIDSHHSGTVLILASVPRGNARLVLIIIAGAVRRHRRATLQTA